MKILLAIILYIYSPIVFAQQNSPEIQALQQEPEKDDGVVANLYSKEDPTVLLSIIGKENNFSFNDFVNNNN